MKSSQRNTKGKFKKGASGNPAGRPAGSRNKGTLACEQLLDDECQLLILKAMEMGKKGNISAIREIGDRCEGRPAITIQGDGSPDKIMLLVEAMTERSREIGHPEGWVPPLLKSGEEQEEAQNDE